MTLSAQDEKWMRVALRLAKRAAVKGEVPVAAILVADDKVLSYAINSRERQQTPLGHAELFALHKGSQKRQSWRLSDCTLYVTLEPCVMCAGAIQQARLKRVVFGAADPKGGGVMSLYNILKDPRLNHQTNVTSGVLAAECLEVLQGFFQDKRDEKKLERAQKKYRERASVLVVHDRKILGFHAVDPTSRKPYFFIPGGAIEEGESYPEAAVRECFEETGYRIKVVEDSLFERKYEFQWDGSQYDCHTYFYLAELIEPWAPPKKVNDASYHRGVDWIDVKDVNKVFSYDKDILWAVQKLLKRALRKTVLP